MREPEKSEIKHEKKASEFKDYLHLEEHRKKSLRNMAVGAIIGIGGILPGVSGGVIAVSLGLYRPMIDSVAGFFKAPKQNFLFLAPIGIGALLGLLLGSVVLNSVMVDHYTQVMYLFLGLVAGGIPSFIREANEEGFKPRYLIATAVGMLLACAMLFLENDTDTSDAVGTLTPIEALLSGAIVSIGTVIPGISTSFILMYLGWYRPTMAAIASINIPDLIFLVIGGAGFALAVVRVARWVFARFHGWAYYGVLGFLVVSAVLIFPGFTAGWGQIVSILLAVGGFFTALLFGRLGH